MSRLFHKLRNWTIHVMDLPPDILVDMPRLSMIGNRKLVIENHCGIIYFSDQCIRLAIHAGEIELQGSSFIIQVMWTKEIWIEGNIHHIDYHITEELS